MKLHWSPRSPFVRKVMIVAHELGLADRIECVRTVAGTTTPQPALMKDNPLSKLPTLVLDDGSALYDSPVICEYLDHLAGGGRMFPVEFGARLVALRRQALGDGMLDMLVLWRGEMLRQEAMRSQAHIQSFATRNRSVLGAIEKETADLARTPFNIGHVALGSVMSYLDFRFPEIDWRRDFPAAARWHATFMTRPSVRATEPEDDYVAPAQAVAAR